MEYKLKIYLFLLTLCALQVTTYAQKILLAKQTVVPIKIDGILNDEGWRSAPLATGFTEWIPGTGASENYTSRTEIYILYDSTSIYIGGYCHEATADSVSHELVGRDAIGNNDFAGIIFDTYNDKINATGFFITPLSEQRDIKYSNTMGEEIGWNAVWYSESKIVKDGWTFEMRIPYAALRFSPKTKNWGLNILRSRNKTNQLFAWNPVSPTVNGFINQEGLWTGITRSKPPVRLSFSPYFSAYYNHYPYNVADVKNSTGSVNGGMDVKYGINQNYTLDLTLIPDFGQVQSDKKVLNLTPFEVKYDDYRPFFTEGTELFNKGNLYYSRRIGGEPLHKYNAPYNLAPNEEIVDNPSESKLLNATKISGRSKKGLGLGFFNALTKTMYAAIEDTLTHQQRTVETGPLTNYNIVVVDQTLKNNSSVSFINTNVLRSGSDYDANVSAGIFNLNNKKNSINFNGKVALSNIIAVAKTTTGYSHSFTLGKTNGRFTYSIFEELTNHAYYINDMGFLYNNDYLNHLLYLKYQWVTPQSWYRSMNLNFKIRTSHRFSDLKTQGASYNLYGTALLHNLWKPGAYIAYFTNGNNFYEPRRSGRVFKTGSSSLAEVWMGTNTAKKYFAYADVAYTIKSLLGGRFLDIITTQRYRFNNKFSLTADLNYSPYFNNVGFAGVDANYNIIFSKRMLKTADNTLTIKYNFSKKSGINMVTRHYWSQLTAHQFYTLNTDGSLALNNTYNENKNYNVNLFNIDLVYSWQFASGSFVNIVWKNAISTSNNDAQYHYFKNFGNTLKADQNNNFSIKVLYYLDYLSLKKKK